MEDPRHLDTPFAVADGDGRRLAIDGSIRFVVHRSGAIEVAPVYLPSSVVWVARLDDGWAFMTIDGDVARADTFLGPLRPLGRFPCDSEYRSSYNAWPGFVRRIAFVDEAGSLWTTDGRAPLRRADVFGRARKVAFADARHGAAVMEDGRLLLTRDGASWAPHPLGADPAWDLQGGRPGEPVVVDTTGGRFVLDVDGALRHDPTATTARVDQQIGLTPEQDAAVHGSIYGAVYRAPSDGRRCDLRRPSRWNDDGPRPYELPSFRYACRVGGRTHPPADTPTTTARWQVRSSTPRGSLVLDRRSRTTRVGWVGGDGEVVPLPEPFLDDRDESVLRGPWNIDTTPLPDEGLAWVAWEHAYPAASFGVALDVAPDGSVRGRRAFLGADEHVLGFARRGACVGPLLGDHRAGPLRWLPIAVGASGCPPTPTSELPSLPFGRPLPACDATSADEVTLQLRGSLAFEFEHAPGHEQSWDDGERSNEVTLRLTPAGYCLDRYREGVVMHDRPSAPSLQLDAVAGELRGYSVSPDDVARRLRCEAAASNP